MTGPSAFALAGLRSRAALRMARAIFLPRLPEEDAQSDTAFMNARGIIAAGRFIMVVFVAGFFLFAAMVPLDSAIVAPGVVVVESHRKTIQHLEGGIVSRVLVREGQDVAAGQPLLLLDENQARANLGQLVQNDAALEALEARLTAERDGRDAVDFPQALLARRDDPGVAAALRGEENSFATRRQTLAKQTGILGQRRGENERLIAGLRSEQASIEKQQVLIDKEIASIQSLYDKGLATLPRLLALQRQAADLAGQHGQVLEKIAQAQLGGGENQLQIANLRSERASEIARDLRETQTKRFDLQERIHAARDVLTRLDVRAPVAGRIVGLEAHTDGAVIKPGETVMEIVPQKDALEVEARVRPEDADAVHASMTAQVNLSAYQRRRLPVINGRVQTVSADRLSDPRNGQPYFSVKLSVDRTPLADYPNARLMPGLPVEVSFNTGARTLLDYLLEPVTDTFRRGMREK